MIARSQPQAVTITDSRWIAIAARDHAAAGDFLYGVTTTAVYCRPGCASRTPLRQNVRFFASRSEAELAGYRPCRRCRPDLDAAPDHGSTAVTQARALLDQAEEPLSLTALAAKVGLSPSHLHRRFSQEVGMSPKAYAATLRLHRLQRQLHDGQPVTRSIYQAGFASSSRFYDGDAKTLGMPAGAYRSGGDGIDIHYAVHLSPFGSVLVAATAEGLCAVEFGESAPDLVERLHKRFAKATLHDDDPAFSEWLALVAATIGQPGARTDVPLDIQGTAFQRRVWKALRDIPPGTTISYGELAERIGQPGSARAVAGACGANTLAVVIPCHRVVRGNGNLGGYRWGLDRKRALLESEAGSAPDRP